VLELSGAVRDGADGAREGPLPGRVGRDARRAALKLLTIAARAPGSATPTWRQTTNALVAAQKSGITGAHNLGKAMGTLDAIVGAGNMRMEDLTKALASGVVPAAQPVRRLAAGPRRRARHADGAGAAGRARRDPVALLDRAARRADAEG
jgi:hypothetical protein